MVDDRLGKPDEHPFVFAALHDDHIFDINRVMFIPETHYTIGIPVGTPGILSESLRDMKTMVQSGLVVCNRFESFDSESSSPWKCCSFPNRGKMVGNFFYDLSNIDLRISLSVDFDPHKLVIECDDGSMENRFGVITHSINDMIRRLSLTTYPDLVRLHRIKPENHHPFVGLTCFGDAENVGHFFYPADEIIGQCTRAFRFTR